MKPWHRSDSWLAACALGLLVLWDASGWDLAVMRWLGNANGFAWREAAVLTLLHKASRVAAWLILAWQGWMALGPQWLVRRNAKRPWPRPALQRYWFGVTLACVVAINVIKYASNTSCPWDLAEFGGSASHVSHWLFWLRDDGPGQCFPSGHSSAAFAFLSLYFLWRVEDRVRARRYALTVCAAGIVLSLTQILRGAHYPSHALWTAWLCWGTCCAADAALRFRQQLKPDYQIC